MAVGEVGAVLANHQLTEPDRQSDGGHDNNDGQNGVKGIVRYDILRTVGREVVKLGSAVPDILAVLIDSRPISRLWLSGADYKKIKYTSHIR